MANDRLARASPSAPNPKPFKILSFSFEEEFPVFQHFYPSTTAESSVVPPFSGFTEGSFGRGCCQNDRNDDRDMEPKTTFMDKLADITYFPPMDVNPLRTVPPETGSSSRPLSPSSSTSSPDRPIRIDKLHKYLLNYNDFVLWDPYSHPRSCEHRPTSLLLMQPRWIGRDLR